MSTGERQSDSEMNIALRTHEEHWRSCSEMNRSAIDAGTATVKALLLLNGGAVLGLLGFIAGSMPGLGETDAGVKSLALTLIWFGWGAALAVTATASAYFVNFCHSASLALVRLAWDHPYLLETRASRGWRAASYPLHLLAVLSGFASMACFGIGMYAVRDTLVAM